MTSIEIKTILKERCVSQSKLSTKFGISRQYLWQMINGKRKMRNDIESWLKGE